MTVNCSPGPGTAIVGTPRAARFSLLNRLEEASGLQCPAVHHKTVTKSPLRSSRLRIPLYGTQDPTGTGPRRGLLLQRLEVRQERCQFRDCEGLDQSRRHDRRLKLAAL